MQRYICYIHKRWLDELQHKHRQVQESKKKHGKRDDKFKPYTEGGSFTY